MASEITNILAETADRLLTDQVTRTVLGAAEEGGWPGDLWRALEDNGLTQPLAPEDRGGLGAAWVDAFVIAFAAGYHRAPVSLVESMAAGWLVGRAGLNVPMGPLALVGDSGYLTVGAGKITGSVSHIPWARNADHLVCVINGSVQVVPLEGSTIEPDTNMAGDPRDSVTFDGLDVAASATVNLECDVPIAQALGAAMRAAQMAGAMERAVTLAVTHAQDREQFGRPIAKFQAIQQSLAIAAARAAEARVAAEAAFDGLDKAFTDGGRGLDAALWDIAAAKVVAGEAAGIVYDTVHQVHGAIGFTYEHELHFTTRRLWAWRGEFGAENFWAEYLGRKVLARGAENLWPDLTAAQGAN